eukprot:gnl/TRDRNA2_/TRDRNA2_30357_c0_seq1.p1 gnl/TRDRNA2_/TRDRNA2_30357_c0~~gnl/TRDRNA2_/TRDRNA2_30357_c0_seq1.p1  ORF type:complete len:329 (-),score=47.30 gnl/TRDRNA2_/TRDRNA2_30357_c0_seq1:26-1012(-)
MVTSGEPSPAASAEMVHIGPLQLDMSSPVSVDCTLEEASADVESGSHVAGGAEVVRAGGAATLAYCLIVLGHAGVLSVHSRFSLSEGPFFFYLAAVEVALAFESLVFAAGGLGFTSWGLTPLIVAGRIRLLAAAVAWPWLVPWAAELSCRCGASPPPGGTTLVYHAVSLALFVGSFFMVREVAFLLRGEPPSALDGGLQPRVGDCLPSNALLGGQFRLDKADLEATGRAIFVPARPRKGLYAGSGLSVLAHFAAGISQVRSNGSSPWLLVGVSCALAARRAKASLLPSTWSREGPRLLCRLGELWWLWCCVLELQTCEASSSWLAKCE